MTSLRFLGFYLLAQDSDLLQHSSHYYPLSIGAYCVASLFHLFIKILVRHVAHMPSKLYNMDFVPLIILPF